MERSVSGAMKKDMRTGLYMLRACWATVIEVGVESEPVSSDGRVVGDGTSHATKCTNVVP